MRKDENTRKAFLELVKAGLFPVINSRFMFNGSIAWEAVYQLAEQQGVVGLVAAGIEALNHNNNANFKVPQTIALTFAGSTLQMEQRNKAMNQFIEELVEKMRAVGIYTLLVKGQGVAQCYEKPLWRACGDVDLFLSEDNYDKAKEMLVPLASSVEREFVREKHLGMTIDGWIVELHGRLYSGLSSKIEKELDDVLSDTFYRGTIRSWNNNGVQVFQLGVENDVFYVFTHILQHFYKEGVGLRQICDWCRLMWTYRDRIDMQKLEARIRRSGIMTEWKVFYALASKYLGMPDIGSGLTYIESATPRHSSSKLGSAHGSIADLMVHNSRYDKKADSIMEFVLKTGNMGHNRDMSHFRKKPYLVRKCVSMGRRLGDLINHARIFPMDSLRFSIAIMYNGVRSALRRE